jgi:uncharacterized protein YecE (DUF72 family)
VAERVSEGTARIGCSGWQYRDWRGVVYPPELPQRCWFAWYAEQFDTVELNSTFYRLPAASTVEAWAKAAPPGFEYAVKVGAFGSHRMKLRDPQRWLANHLDRVDRLGDALGPNLVQLPPRWRRDVGRLDDFLEAAPKRIRWAVELREPSWIHDEVFATLERHGAALVLHDLLPDQPMLVTAPFTYLRFHGPDAVEHRYHGRYGGRRLWRWADRCTGWLAGGIDVHAFFNNDYEGHAVADARWLRSAIRSGTGRNGPPSGRPRRGSGSRG